ncbi:hypothetical protein Deiofobo_0379 [Pseudomonas phage Deifobo]|nr:hypothetical protein Deiofobo_0379 [Pseudomonas phage Deifobo]
MLYSTYRCQVNFILAFVTYLCYKRGIVQIRIILILIK